MNAYGVVNAYEDDDDGGRGVNVYLCVIEGNSACVLHTIYTTSKITMYHLEKILQ